jgi:hypothetical protein
MDQVIMTGETKGTFETGIDESVDPFETAQPDTKEKETK